MATTKLTINGSFGEGGGQVLRSSLAMAMETATPFRIENIRAGRKKPGLLRQHLTAVKAAATICGATVRGAEMRSAVLEFEPGEIVPGDYRFAVGTAGSATLVLQTILPALMTADAPSRVTLGGGTHNPWAPPYHFLTRSLLPLLERMGPKFRTQLNRAGFFPAGGGEFVIEITPAKMLASMELPERGDIRKRSAHAVVANLPMEIAERELNEFRRKLDWPDGEYIADSVESTGPGNAVFLEIESEHVTEVFTGFGQKDKPVRRVTCEAMKHYKRYINSGAAVGEYLADQLLVPMALAGGTFRTVKPSLHTTTNIEIIKRFIDVDIRVEQIDTAVWEIALAPNRA